MKYLLDADFLINFLNGRKGALDVLSVIEPQGLAVSVICIAEVLEGLIAFGQRKKYKIFEELLGSVEVIPVDRAVVDVYALVRASLRRQGNLIDKFDLLIASTGLAYDLTLVTNNLKHYLRIPKLKIYK